MGETILTPTGVLVYSIYLDILAVVVLAALIWALARRWIAQPHRLSFDLTRKGESVIIVGLTAGLMVATLLVSLFLRGQRWSGTGSRRIRRREPSAAGCGTGNVDRAAGALQATFWWVHLLVILGFSLYIPFSKHIHMVAAPLNAFFRNLEPRGTLATIDLENVERFGASRVQDFTWKELLDGYACAVCGRCTDACPAHTTGKVLSPMHIVENLKEHMIAIGHQGQRDAEHVESMPLIDGAIPEQAIWDCGFLWRLHGRMPRGRGTRAHHHGYAAQPGFGGIPHPRNRHERPAQHGTAGSSLARHHLLAHRLGRRTGRPHHRRPS